MQHLAFRPPQRLLLGAILSVAAWLAPQTLSSAAACSCAPQTVNDAERSAQAVFEGYVLEATEQPDGQLSVEFKAVRAWKGVERERVRLVGPGSSAACGVRFEKGNSYLVFAQENADVPGALTTGLCSGTKPMMRAEADLRALGMGYTTFEPREMPKEEKKDEPPARGGCASCAIGAGGADGGKVGWWLAVAAGAWLSRRRGLR